MKTTTLVGTGGTFLAGVFASLFVAYSPVPEAALPVGTDNLVTGSVIIRPVLSPRAVDAYKKYGEDFIKDFEKKLNDFAMKPFKDEFGKLPAFDPAYLEDPKVLFFLVKDLLGKEGLVPVRHTGFSTRGFKTKKTLPEAGTPGTGEGSVNGGAEYASAEGNGELSYIWVDDVYVCVDNFEVQESNEAAAAASTADATAEYVAEDLTPSGRPWTFVYKSEEYPAVTNATAKLSLGVALVVGDDL